MGAPRKNPPDGALQKIEEMASSGHTIIGIAKALGVSRETFKRWCDDDYSFQEAFEIGRDKHRQYLVSLVVEAAKANKNANSNAMFLLKTMHGFREFDSANSKVDVSIGIANNVMVVRDFGTNEEWAARVAEQQRKLTGEASDAPQLKASTAPVIDATPLFDPPAPVYAPPVWKNRA